jgi:CRISPR-associated protein Cas1
MRDGARTSRAGSSQGSCRTRRLLQRWAWDASTPQRRALRRFAGLIETRVERVAQAEGGDRIRGYEGDGARIYFRGLGIHLVGTGCPLAFDRRTRRPPRDPVNAALSFAYGLLLSEVTGAVEALGLDPQVGFLHGVRPGRPSLALDLLEELRPTVADRFVVGLFTRRMLSEIHFVTTTGGACYLTDGGRQTFFEAYETFKSSEVPHALLGRSVPRAALPVVQATLMTRHLRGDLPAYPPYVMSG